MPAPMRLGHRMVTISNLGLSGLVFPRSVTDIHSAPVATEDQPEPSGVPRPARTYFDELNRVNACRMSKRAAWPGLRLTMRTRGTFGH